MINNTSTRLITLTNQLIYSSSFIGFSAKNTFGKVILDRPKALNSLNLEMVQKVESLFPELQKTKAFWMEGAGGKAFCAGGDVKTLFENEAKYEVRQEFFRHQFTMDYNLSKLKAIQISNWDGIVMGGGVGISINSPFKIATQKSMFAMPEGKIGFFTDVAACYFLSKMRSNIGYYLAMTSARITGEDVYNSGLANYYILRDDLVKVYEELEQQVPKSENPKQTIAKVLNKYHKGQPNKKIKNEDEINQLFSGSTVQEIYGNVMKAKGQFPESVKKNLQEFCPLSIHVIHRLIKTVGNKSLKECFIRDFEIAKYFSNDANFREGVTALLINKGSEAKWTHKNLMQVDEKDVDKVFVEQKENRLDII